MVDWFFSNFEDPVHETPYNSREGGYLYIWGGPYDATDELYQAFPEASDTEIEQVVAEIESDGIGDWAPAGIRIQPEDIDVDDELTLDERIAALSEQLDRIQESVAYWRNQPPGIDHNQPPDEFRIAPDDKDLQEVEESIQEIRVELEKPDAKNAADPTVINNAEGRFRKLARKIAGWLKKLGTGLVIGVAGGIGKVIGENIASDPEALLSNLQAAADTLSVWASYLF
ncbi:MAG: hypothetical protein R3E04_00080 [Sphingobium sp.]